MTKLKDEKGLGIIGIIIILAIIFAALNAYAYYNPTFSLARYSPFNYFKAQRDERRIKDLNVLKDAVAKYYEANSKMPGASCGRISGVLHPEFVNDIKPYLTTKDVPFDPVNGNGPSDYFYYRMDDSRYMLMTALELPKEDNKGKYNGVEGYDFSSRCHDWPGPDVYNYRITNIEF